MPFDYDQYRLHLAQERQEQRELNLADWGGDIHFDESRHPRLHGRFVSGGGLKGLANKAKLEKGNNGGPASRLRSTMLIHSTLNQLHAAGQIEEPHLPDKPIVEHETKLKDGRRLRLAPAGKYGVISASIDGGGVDYQHAHGQHPSDIVAAATGKRKLATQDPLKRGPAPDLKAENAGEVKIGDRVEMVADSASGMGNIPKGTRGIVKEVADNSSLVHFGNGVQTRIRHDKLKKV